MIQIKASDQQQKGQKMNKGTAEVSLKPRSQIVLVEL